MLIFKNKDSEWNKNITSKEKRSNKKQKVNISSSDRILGNVFSISGFQIFTMSVYGLVRNNCYLQG